MEFDFSEETNLLRESASRFLKEKCSAFTVREQLLTEEGFSPDIWQGMAELGWMGLVFDEKYGGYEGDFFDLFVLDRSLDQTQRRRSLAIPRLHRGGEIGSDLICKS